MERARNGAGPTLIECKTYRQRGHSRFEKSTYRAPEEVQQWLARDPIQRFRAFLCARGLLTEAEADAIRQTILQTLAEAVAFARHSPEPPPEAALHYVFATNGAR